MPTSRKACRPQVRRDRGRQQGQVSEQAAREPADGGDWRRAWDGMTAAVGRDFSGGAVTYGADPVAVSDIRRFLEPAGIRLPATL